MFLFHDLSDAHKSGLIRDLAEIRITNRVCVKPACTLTRLNRFSISTFTRTVLPSHHHFCLHVCSVGYLGLIAEHALNDPSNLA